MNKFKNIVNYNRKKFSKLFFYSLYGKIKDLKFTKKNYKFKIAEFDKFKKYKIHFMQNSRIYYNKITDVAYINNNSFIKDPSSQIRNFKNLKSKNNSVFINGTPNFIKKINGSTCSFLYTVSAKENYWHWMFDVLPKIPILKKKVNFNKINFFLFPEINKRFQKESLNVLNIPHKKRLSGHKFNHIFSKNIISSDHPFINKDMLKDQKKFPIWIGKWFKKIIKNNKIKRKSKLDKIYIDRSDSKNIFRTIVNEKELKTFLSLNSFKIITLSKISFLKQVEIFYNASCVLGLHGAGFANIVFCRPKTKIIEIGTTKKSNNIIFSLAKANNLNYKCIFFKKVKKNLHHSSRHQDQHLKVNTQILKNVI